MSKYKLPEGKVKLQGYISKEASERFKRVVEMRHGRCNGLFSYELEQAILNYCSNQVADTHTQNGPTINPNPKAFILKTQIRKWLLEKKEISYSVQTVLREFVIEAIGEIKGLDERTKQKWFDILVKYQCIKVNPSLGQFVEIP